MNAVASNVDNRTFGNLTEDLLSRRSRIGHHYSRLKTWALRAGLVLAVPAFLAATVPAQAATTTKSGVYTTSQASQGKALYAGKCEMCHGGQLQGSGANPALAGSAFLDKWQGQTVGDLYSFVHTNMPATAPGSLTPQETVEAVAYILQANKMPAGKKPLSTNPAVLKTIKIVKP